MNIKRISKSPVLYLLYQFISFSLDKEKALGEVNYLEITDKEKDDQREIIERIVSGQYCAWFDTKHNNAYSDFFLLNKDILEAAKTGRLCEDQHFIKVIQEDRPLTHGRSLQTIADSLCDIGFREFYQKIQWSNNAKFFGHEEYWTEFDNHSIDLMRFKVFLDNEKENGNIDNWKYRQRLAAAKDINCYRYYCYKDKAGMIKTPWIDAGISSKAYMAKRDHERDKRMIDVLRAQVKQYNLA